MADDASDAEKQFSPSFPLFSGFCWQASNHGREEKGGLPKVFQQFCSSVHRFPFVIGEEAKRFLKNGCDRGKGGGAIVGRRRRRKRWAWASSSAAAEAASEWDLEKGGGGRRSRGESDRS